MKSSHLQVTHGFQSALSGSRFYQASGFGGGLYPHILYRTHPDDFSFMKSLEYLLYLYIGGSGSISGAITGAFVFTLIPELFRSLQLWRMVIYSLLLVIIMLFRPDGIVGDREFPFIRQNRQRFDKFDRVLGERSSR